MPGADAPVNFLVVDPEPRRHTLYRDLLGALGGQVVTIVPGEDARTRLRADRFAFVILHVDGWERQVRTELAGLAISETRPSHGGVIVVSGEMPEDFIPGEGLDGAYEFVPAPFVRELLTQRVACLLELRRAKAELAAERAKLAKLVSEVGRLDAEIDVERTTAGTLRAQLAAQAHSSKNLLAVLQSLALRTIRDGRDVAEMREVLTGRFRALARAHQRIAAGDGEWIDLAPAVEALLADIADRSSAHGPPVKLARSVAQTFMLALHELAANALQHGALRSCNGKVAIEWALKGAGPERYLEVKWRERGGEPAPAPSHYGFGLTLASSFADGKAPTEGISFDAEGLTCCMRLSHEMIDAAS
ncbi:HWE histidine kinase domain-containing protein [Hyphomicrobium sp.]|uniref:HWE histidine kinase domain-containing protein n=1 Tax=Hyphomicrobium sp. TaxID=82 RepID=UPI002FDD89D2